MYSVTFVITLVLFTGVTATIAQQRRPLRCYICVTDYEDSVEEPGCSITSPNVIVRGCNIQHGFDRCISYRARNPRTGNTVFRRHCATPEMCEYQCLFSHHTNCEKQCCNGDLCNDFKFGRYVGTSERPRVTSNVPVTTQSPITTPRKDPTTSSQSTRYPTVTLTTTNPPVTTHKLSNTEEPLIGGPPDPITTSIHGCRDFREECSRFAGYPGYCQYTRYFMLIHCPYSCRFCVNGGTTRLSTDPTTATRPQEIKTTSKPRDGGSGPQAGCSDARQECAYFANFDGYCEYHYAFMFTHCPRSCKHCDYVPLPESPAEAAYTTTTLPPLTTSEREIRTFDTFPKEPTPFGPGGEEYENYGCFDLRENCTFYATKYDDYCNYNKDFMKIHCPFSCGFCGTSVPNVPFPHPPIISEHQFSDEEFPPPPGEKDVRWISSFCSECHNGFQKCTLGCILLMKDGVYEPTSNDVCIKILGKPSKMFPC
ncbi:uncharacterized protein LOC114518322 [Dendronephthya gigantea]|uniref:uncharacterized protein LOC114518322 n=1 Tax=Dendronephthya gigantea TaxID=151771 RepID=UPI00106CAB16|nr:uncharacterized protein LOC114518322 [Dendronephthya gigantea]